MEKTITTALLIAISMIMVTMLFNVAYPAVIQGGEAVTGMANGVAERMRNQISIIHASAELDDTGIWQDVNGNGQFDAFVWVKNIGSARIVALDHLDVFFGPEGNYMRIPQQSQAQGSFPNWTSEVDGGGDWEPTGTLQIVVHYHAPLPRGRYFMKVILPDGVSSEDFLGI